MAGQLEVGSVKVVSPNGLQSLNLSVSDVGAVVSNKDLSADKLPLTGGRAIALHETSVAMTNGLVNLSLGNYFSRTITAATTLTISGALASPATNSFFLRLTNAGAFPITWFSGVKWGGGTAPTLTVSGVDILGFVSIDGGLTYDNTSIRKDVR